MIYSNLCQAGQWVRTSPTSISFTGVIDKDELSRFLEIYKPSDETLLVNSSGGNVAAALDIGTILIKNAKLTVVVQGMCASSCANYLFLAGHGKKIDKGLVGFHGNWRAMAATEKFKNQAALVEPRKRYEILSYHEQKIKQETEFFIKAGVSQKLFEKTQTENDSGLYDIYAPGPKQFRGYGIQDVVGIQDKEVLKDWPSTKVQFDEDTNEEEKNSLRSNKNVRVNSVQ